MIFATVGTHEQQFDRLVKAVDDFAQNEESFIQIGYSGYIPKNACYKEMLSYEEMVSFMSAADVVITHGGPGSIMMALELGKMPVVIPRQKSFGEHVNNHQVYFCRHFESEGNCILVEDVVDLARAIEKARFSSTDCSERIQLKRSQFVSALKNAVSSLLE